MGTARILTLSLANCHHFVGEDFSRHVELNALLTQADVQHFILYPGEGAIEATQLQSKGKKIVKHRIILLDGTWKKAYKMWQLSLNLHPLPLIQLPSHFTGNYRIRKAPSDNALSTVEAGYHILSILEPDNDFSPLLQAFEQMIEFQIKQMPPGVFEQNYFKS